jgi:PPOX class probable F420-dependent enzyme
VTVELTQEVTDRLNADLYGWLTTVTKTGQPVPRLVWFYFDGSDVVIYTRPGDAKVRHIQNHPLASLNLDSDGDAAGIIVVGGAASVDATDVEPRDDRPFWAKYATDAERFGLTEEFSAYSTRLRISIDKVWVTPTV